MFANTGALPEELGKVETLLRVITVTSARPM